MRRPALAAAAAVGAAVALSLGRSCLPGRFVLDTSPTRDLYHLSTLYEVFARHVLSGRLPLWLPEFQAGFPVAAAWMYGLLYPPVLLFGVLPAETAWAVLAVAHAAWAAAGTFRLVHGLRGDAAAAGAAAVVLGTSEFLVGRLFCGHLNLVMAFAWVPWVLDAAGRAARGERRGPGLLAVTLGAGLIAGHVQVWFYAGPLVVAFAVVEAARVGAGRGLIRGVLPGLALGVALAGIQAVPAIGLRTLGEREPLPGGHAWALSAPALAAKLVPGALGSRPDHPWGLAEFDDETTAVAGLAVVLLALAGLLGRGRGRWLFGAAALAGILGAFGEANPVGRLLDRFLFLGSGRAPGRVLLLLPIAAAVLAGHGVADLRAAAPAARRRRLTLAGGLALAALAAAAVVLARHAARIPGSRLLADGGPALAASLAGAALVVGAVLLAARRPTAAVAIPASLLAAAFLGAMPSARTVSSAFYHHDWKADLPEAARDHRVALLDDRLPNVERSGVRTLREMCPIDAPWYERFVRFDVVGLDRWLDVAAAAFPPEPRPGGDEFAGPWRLVTQDRPAAGPALFFPSAAAGGDDDGRVLAELRARGDGLWLAGRPAGAGGEPAAGSPEGIRVDRSEGPGRLAADVDAPADGWLLLSEKFWPGWTATVDGEPAAIERANVTFRAVRVPAGRHRVEMAYAPWSWRIGLMVSLAAAAVLLTAGRRRHSS